MKRTIRENINPAYCLHDMNVIAFEVNGNNIIMRTQSGMVKTTPPSSQINGYVEFHNVQWDFSFVYLLGVTGNEGIFTGEKKLLKDFVSKAAPFGFSVMDETYEYNTAKFRGHLLSNREHHECFIEISHEGDMVFVES